MKNRLIKQLMLVALIVFGATGAWAQVTQGPWTYMAYRTGCCDRNANPAISFDGLNNSHWATVDGPWCDGDGVGFTVKNGTANSNSKNGVYSTYYIDQTLESYSRKVLTWTFVLGSKSKKHYSNTCLYGLQGTWQQINALTVDFTEDYSNKTGSGNLLAQYRNTTLSGNGVFTGNYTKTFTFDNRNNASSTTKSWCLLLTHVVSSVDPVDGISEWGSFKHVSATWTTYYYKYVTFNANQGSGSMSQQTIENSGKLTANAFSRTGYTFDGWATSSTGSKAYDNQGDISATSGSKGNVTLYARWKANTYTVTLNQQSGTGGSGSVTATYAAGMPSITVPTRTGYTFQGYYTGANGAGTKYYNANGTSAKNWDKTAATTLYAYWTANTYTVTLNQQSGTGGSGSVTATYAAAMPSMTIPTRTGYVFQGYFTEAGGAGTKYYNPNGTSAKNWDKTAATTLYAYWTAGTYTVTLDMTGGEGGSASVTATYDADMPAVTLPTRDGYFFDGYSDIEGKLYYTATGESARKYDVGAALTLYAQWVDKSIPVPQPSGEWQAYMPAGNRMLRITYKDEPELAWEDQDEQPVTAISGYHGFQSLVAIPNLKVSDKFSSALIAGTSAVEFFSSNPDIVSVAGSDFSINGVGEADLSAIHRNDADFKYDSAAFHVTVLAPDTLNLQTNDAEWGTVAAVTPLSDSVRAGEGNKFFAVPGATMTVQATPAEGFHLRYWSNGAAVDATLRAKAQVQGKTDLLAFFAPDTVPAIVTKEPVVFDTLVYTGAGQIILANGTAIGGQFKYSTDSTTWSTDLPQFKDAGTHTFYCYVDSTDVLHRCLPVETHTVTIAKAPLTITAENKDTIYGDPAPAFTAAYTGLLGEDTVGVVSGLTLTSDYLVTSNVGNYTIVPADAQAANYAISYTNGTLTVNKAPLMITAENKDTIYGDPAPAFTETYSGWKNADTKEVVSGLTLTSEYLVTSNVGEYDIVPANATAQNYEISYTNGTLTVNKATLTITANDTAMIYGDEHPEFTATYEGWKNEDNEAVVSDLDYTCEYVPGSYIGTYAINPHSATAQNYAFEYVDGTLTVNKAVVKVVGAEAQIAKIESGTTDAVVLNAGTLDGIKLSDPIGHETTASFSDATVGENKTITLYYTLTGDAALLTNYDLIPTSEIFTAEGVIIEDFIPAEEGETEKEDDEAQIEEGIEVYAYGYCDGSGYSLRYHLNSGNPDQYKIDFDDSRFTDVDWTDLTTPGPDGTIDIEIPVDLPTGDYSFTATFRDSRFTWLESNPFTVTFHVNLPETYVTPLFNNTIALVDTCNCFTDIQWYHRADASEAWQPIEGATGHYYRPEGGAKLTGEYFVKASMNGEPTYTCGQADMETLYGADKQQPKATVKAFPNPVVNTTTVTIENSENWNHSLRVVNLTGVEMFRTTFEGNETVVRMDGFVQGNYMISVDGIVVKVMKK